MSNLGPRVNRGRRPQKCRWDALIEQHGDGLLQMTERECMQMFEITINQAKLMRKRARKLGLPGKPALPAPEEDELTGTILSAMRRTGKTKEQIGYARIRHHGATIRVGQVRPPTIAPDVPTILRATPRPSMTVYALEGREGVWYIGRTQRPALERLQEHQGSSSSLSNWKLSNGPWELRGSWAGNNRFAELSWTLEHMLRHGPGKVRGGPFCGWRNHEKGKLRSLIERFIEHADQFYSTREREGMREIMPGVQPEQEGWTVCAGENRFAHIAESLQALEDHGLLHCSSPWFPAGNPYPEQFNDIQMLLRSCSFAVQFTEPDPNPPEAARDLGTAAPVTGCKRVFNSTKLRKEAENNPALLWSFTASDLMRKYQVGAMSVRLLRRRFPRPEGLRAPKHTIAIPIKEPHWRERSPELSELAARAEIDPRFLWDRPATRLAPLHGVTFKQILLLRAKHKQELLTRYPREKSNHELEAGEDREPS